MKAKVKETKVLNVSKDIFELRKTNFVLWRPGISIPAPKVYIATVEYDYVNNSFSFEKVAEKKLFQASDLSDLWLLDMHEIQLKEGLVYYYWFKIINTNPYEKNNNVLYCTDPFATVVDERIQAHDLPVMEVHQHHYSPAGVFMVKNDQMIAADPDREIPEWENFSTSMSMNRLPDNRNLVIYEMPIIWSYVNNEESPDEPANVTAEGNFQQVEKMIAFDSDSTYLDKLLAEVIDMNGKKYLEYLGINALECCPPANSSQQHGWGYCTSDFFAADYSLSDREKKSVGSPKPATAFAKMVKACNKRGIRYFYDAVMAFTSNNSYRHINYSDFFVQWNSGDPEQGNRDGFGGDLVKYRYFVDGYNPNSTNGIPSSFSPSREFMKAHLKEWIKNKGISGIRLDSIVNIDCYDFLQEVKEQMTQYYKDQVNGLDEKMLIVGEELAVPAAILEQNRLDGLWNELFKQIMRDVILGKNWSSDNFESSVKKMIDCRLLGRNFTKGTQAVNYFTSHDVGGFKNERLFNYLINNGIIYTEERIKLAFACLMTAVGIPMFLGGEEFADAQDLFGDNEKQVDAINYERLKVSDWRQRIFHQVVNLVRFRTQSNAFASDNIEFIHSDFNDNKRVMAWKRGSDEDMVITVANFSDWASNPNTEYIINNWPDFNGAKIPLQKKWREVMMGRDVDPQYVGCESLYPWEAKVYVCVDL